jgi:V/A-type H+-transporting ATPase subunit C
MTATQRLSDDPKYGFAVGRIRSLETSLLDRPRYDRLARARDVAEFLALVRDTPYGRFFEGGQEADFDAAMDAAGRDNEAFFKEYTLDPWLGDVFRLPGAMRRLKAGVKRRLAAGEEIEAGATDELAAAAADKARAAVAAAAREYHEKHDPARVDITLDRLEQELVLQAAGPSDFLVGLHRLHADIENLRTLVRLRAFEDKHKDREGARKELVAALLLGGSIDEKLLLSLLDEEWENMGQRLGSPYRHVVEEGVAGVQAKRSLLRMERLGREAELSYLRQTRYATFGHEVLVTFFLLRESEMRNLRALHAAGVAGLGEETALELVAYVE